MPDDEWMGVVGPRRWVVLSQDRRFHIEDVEKEAVLQHGIKCFYFPCASDTTWVSMGYFMRYHDKMVEIAERTAAPFVFDLQKNGQLLEVPL